MMHAFCSLVLWSLSASNYITPGNLAIYKLFIYHSCTPKWLIKSMETSQPLPIESFSYSWLSNVKSQLDSLDVPLRTSIDGCHQINPRELDYKVIKSKRPGAQNFIFDIPFPQYLIDADQLFSNGLMKPAFIDPSRVQLSSALNSIQAMPGSSFPSRAVVPADTIPCCFLRRLRKLPKRIFRNYYRCLRFLFQEIGCSRNGSRVTNIDTRVGQVKRWSMSPHTSPRESTACSMEEWYHLENSIDEAILYCKRSIEK